jgi:phospholipid/cholesterol/gamma-HCH transport system permease protein
MVRLGVDSVPIAVFIAIFTGIVLSLLSSYIFTGAVPLYFVGALVGKTVMMELGPVLTGMALAGRVGANIAAELGTMRVTEQVDALETMAVNPVQYLLVPRVLSGLVMLPVLDMLFDTAGLFGAYFVAVIVKGISAGTFLTRTQQWLDPEDIFEGLIKAAVFGLAVTLIACFKGYNASGGAKGVGKATTEAMVASALSIFILDYIVGILLHG